MIEEQAERELHDKNINIRVSARLRAQIQATARLQRRTMCDWCRMTLADEIKWLAEQAKK